MSPQLAAAACLAAGVAAVFYGHLRHAGLTALILLAPLPGLIAGAGLGLVWCGSAGALAPVYLLSALTGLLWADAFLVATLDGVDDAAGRARRLVWPPALAACAAIVLPLLAFSGDGFARSTVLALSGAMGSCAILLPAAAHMRLDEDFMARTNRMREWEQRQLDVLIAAARPRWGAAVSGIALIFAVLAWFGLAPLQTAPARRPEAIVLLAVAAAALLAASAVSIRDTRMLVASVWTLLLILLIWGWGQAVSNAMLTSQALVMALVHTGASALLVLRAARVAGGYGRNGDDATLAAARVLARDGAGLAAGGSALLAGSLCAVPFISAWPLVGAALFAALAPLLWLPAFAISIETIYPRAASLAARYRRH